MLYSLSSSQVVYYSPASPFKPLLFQIIISILSRKREKATFTYFKAWVFVKSGPYACSTENRCENKISFPKTCFLFTVQFKPHFMHTSPLILAFFPKHLFFGLYRRLKKNTWVTRRPLKFSDEIPASKGKKRIEKTPTFENQKLFRGHCPLTALGYRSLLPYDSEEKSFWEVLSLHTSFLLLLFYILV